SPELARDCWSCARPCGAARMAANWVSSISQKTAPTAKSQGSQRRRLPGKDLLNGLDSNYIRGYNLTRDTTYRSQRLSPLSPTAQRQAGGTPSRVAPHDPATAPPTACLPLPPPHRVGRWPERPERQRQPGQEGTSLHTVRGGGLLLPTHGEVALSSPCMGRWPP